MLYGRQPNRGFEHEHAGVPVVAAFAQVLLGGLEVGLFYEGSDIQDIRARGCAPTLVRHRALRCAAALGGADVAVAGFGFVGGDTQDDDIALLGLGNGLFHGGGECRWLGDGLVCGGDDQHRVLAVLHSGQGRQGQSGGGVAACWLEQGGAQGNAYFTQLLGCQKAVVFAADDDGGCDVNAFVA